EGREIVLPTQFVLPDAPREGLVINLAQLRMYYFPKPKDGEPHKVITHPIGIGKVGWSTPVGTTKVTAKAKNPTWYPPASVRKEHAEAGDPLPSKVPPGPDNPLGTHMMKLGWPSYLIHGTNKPYGVGLRSSHGCVRFYPEDIGRLYDMVPIGTKVTVVNQPFVFGWQGDALYVQAFPVLEDDEREHPNAAEALLNAAISDEMWQQVKEHGAVLDLELIDRIVSDPRGIAIPVSYRDVTLENLILTARHVENALPEGATWNGSDETFFTAEEFEAARSGTVLPKKTDAAKDTKKTVATTAGAAAAGGALSSSEQGRSASLRPTAHACAGRNSSLARSVSIISTERSGACVGPVVARARMSKIAGAYASKARAVSVSAPSCWRSSPSTSDKIRSSCCRACSRPANKPSKFRTKRLPRRRSCASSC